MFLSRGRECAPANAANEDANEDCTVGNTHAENTATPKLDASTLSENGA